MKTLSLSFLGLALLAGSAFGQMNTLYQTTLSAAALATDNVLYVTSATNMSAPAPQSATPAGSELYIVDPGNPRGEIANIISISSTAITVRRSGGGARTAHVSGAMVLFGPPNWFRNYDPSGGCTLSTTYVAPHVNTFTGLEWECSPVTLTWVPGWQNPNPAAVGSAVVASVAGATAVNSPLQHISGTNAITSFTMGTGWNQGPFCIIPDGAFTTTATNNIGKASTAVANKPLCYVWDATNSVFDPSY